MGQGEAGYGLGALYGSTVVSELVGGGADGGCMVVIIALIRVRFVTCCCVHLDDGVENILDRDALRSGRW